MNNVTTQSFFLYVYVFSFGMESWKSAFVYRHLHESFIGTCKRKVDRRGIFLHENNNRVEFCKHWAFSESSDFRILPNINYSFVQLIWVAYNSSFNYEWKITMSSKWKLLNLREKIEVIELNKRMKVQKNLWERVDGKE